MSKRSAKRREEWRQERIEAIGQALGRFVMAAGAGNQVNLVALAEVAVDALDEYDRERRLDIEAEKDVLRGRLPADQSSELRSAILGAPVMRRAPRLKVR